MVKDKPAKEKVPFGFAHPELNDTEVYDAEGNKIGVIVQTYTEDDGSWTGLFRFDDAVSKHNGD